MSDTWKRRSFKIAYVIDEVALRQLQRILSETGVGCEYTIALEDGSQMTFDDVEDVISMPNSKINPIERISAASWNMLEKMRISMELRPGLYGGAIEYMTSGTEQQCIAWSRKLDEWVDEAKTWYSRIAVTDFVMFMLGSSLVLAFVVLLFGSIFLLVRGESTDSESDDGSSLVIAIFGLVVFTTFALGLILNVIRTRLFPIATFAIGYGKKRHEGTQRLREFVGITIIVSFLVNILAAIILGVAG